MKPVYLLPRMGAILAASGFVAAAAADDDTKPRAASPIYGVTIPEGYRQWELIAPAEEADPLNELRTVLGKVVATRAYREATLPFPDGTILAKLAWKRIQSPEFESASVPGAATTVQVMVKDSKKYASTGGWGFGRFVDGKPASPVMRRAPRDMTTSSRGTRLNGVTEVSARTPRGLGNL
jgi:hypothetical protein